MTMSFRHPRLQRLLRQFRSANAANVTVTFALATIPIVGFVGAAVDYSHANSVKAAMMAAGDTAALMLSKDAAALTNSQLQTKANEYFKALFNRPEATNLVVAATYTSSSGSTLTLTASSSVKTSFMNVMGFSSLKVGTNSVVKWGNIKLRVALALDITGSMSSDGKMTALKTATKNLLNQLKAAAAKDGDVYVSIIPFNKDVNLGTSNYTVTSWLDWTEWEAEPPYMATWLANSSNQAEWEQVGPGDSCPFSNSSHGFKCMSTPTGTSSTSTIPSSGTYKGYICPGEDNGNKVSRKANVRYNGCYNSVSDSRIVDSGWGASCDGLPNCSCSGSGSKKKCTQNYYQHTWVKNARSTWNGCVADRGDQTGPNTGNYDTNATAPISTNNATKYPAEQFADCFNYAAMGLSYNWSGMTTLVDNLTPVGNTNQGVGLQLGWLSLVGGGPFTAPAKDANYKYNEVIILMSDGMNTQNRWSTSQSAIDAREALTCTNAKNAGFTIYAIQVNTGGDPTQAVMKNCATNLSKFYELKNANDLISTFEMIGTALSNLRIAQ
jgi:Flp pilus assembly protein TadG